MGDRAYGLLHIAKRNARRNCNLRSWQFPLGGLLENRQAESSSAAGFSASDVWLSFGARRCCLMSQIRPSLLNSQMAYQFKSISYQRNPCRAEIGWAW